MNKKYLIAIGVAIVIALGLAIGLTRHDTQSNPPANLGGGSVNFTQDTFTNGIVNGNVLERWQMLTVPLGTSTARFVNNTGKELFLDSWRLVGVATTSRPGNFDSFGPVVVSTSTMFFQIFTASTTLGVPDYFDASTTAASTPGLPNAGIALDEGMVATNTRVLLSSMTATSTANWPGFGSSNSLNRSSLANPIVRIAPGVSLYVTIKAPPGCSGSDGVGVNAGAVTEQSCDSATSSTRSFILNAFLHLLQVP